MIPRCSSALVRRGGFRSLAPDSRLLPIALVAVSLATFGATHSGPPTGGQIRFSLHNEPRSLDPQNAIDAPGEAVRYLTGGCLLRLNRKTQQIEPELAESYRVSADSRSITLRLRPQLHFSDGSSFTSEDVAFTLRRVLDPKLQSPSADSFRFPAGAAVAVPLSALEIQVRFPVAVASPERLFDDVPIQSAHAADSQRATLGPFYIAEYTPGVSLKLLRNPQYWKRDTQGQPLPYLDSILLTFQKNRDIELQQFRRGELQFISGLDPELFDQLKAESHESAIDGGPSLEGEQLWFNLAPQAPLPDYKKAWFQQAGFRHALSLAINRADIARIVYHGHAQPAAGLISAANKLWFNQSLKPDNQDAAGALHQLAQLGFTKQGDALFDSAHHRVELSILTTGGNKARERMSALIQQDLAQIGIKVTLVTLDGPSLIERFTRTLQFDTVLLGLANMQLDPAEATNVWLSSAPNHQWNANQKTPATPWEAEIDKLVLSASSSNDRARRKAAFDKVQEILAREVPVICLVNKNALSAVSPQVGAVDPVVITPQLFWNREWLYLRSAR